jgi:hypothetical protein
MSIKVKIAYIAYMGKIWHTGHSDSSRIAEREGCTAWVGSSVSHPDPARFGRSNYWLLHNLRLMPIFTGIDLYRSV